MKKIKVFFKKNTFYKILFSYIFLLTIPTFMFYSFYDFKVEPLFERTIRENDLQSLQIFQEGYDTYFLQIEKIVQQIEQKNNFFLEPNIVNVENSRAVLSELSDYVSVTPYLDEIVLYMHGDNYLYTSQTTAPIDTFFERNFIQANISSREMKKNFEKPPIGTTVLADTVSMFSKTRDCIILIEEVHAFSLRDTATIAFYLDAKSMQNLAQANKSENVFVYNHGGDLINSKSNDDLREYLSSKNLQTSLAEVETKNSVFDFKGEKYIVCNVVSTNTGLQYVSYTPMNKLYTELNTLQTYIFLVAMVGVVFGSIAIAYFMKSNYKPLKQLREDILEIFPTKTENVDDIEQISNGIQLLRLQYNEHKAQNEAIERDAYLLRLLYGRANTSKERLAHFGVEFANEEFFVVCIMLKGDIKNLSEIVEIDKYFKKVVDGYLIMGTHHNKHFFIANPKKSQSTGEILQVIHDRFTKSLPDITTTLVAGKRYSKVEDISTSYYGAISAADYSFIMGKHRIILEDELQIDNSLSFDFPKEIFEKLQNALSQGRTEVFYPALNELVEYLKQPKLPIYHVRSVSYMALNACVTVMQDFGDRNFCKKLSNEYNASLSEFETLDELINAVQNIGLNISYYIVKNILANESNLPERMRQYIKDNYSDANFSVQTIADEFEMTSVNISKYFKKNTGYTIVEYLTEIRMSKAKELLKENHLTLDEIVENVGYLNTSSFIRKFKQLYDVTPRQYTL